MVEQLPRLIPFIWSKLPCLPRRHHAHDPVPRVRSEFSQSLNGVYDEVSCLRLGFSAGRVDVCAFTINRNQVFRARVAIGSCAGAGFLGGFKTVWQVLIELEDRRIRGNVRGFGEETFDVVHCDEGSR
jgi:hypothetical protein